jgi:hypothetical protein
MNARETARHILRMYEVSELENAITAAIEDAENTALLTAAKDALEHLEYLSRFTKQVSPGVMSQLRSALAADPHRERG